MYGRIGMSTESWVDTEDWLEVSEWPVAVATERRFLVLDPAGCGLLLFDKRRDV